MVSWQSTLLSQCEQAIDAVVAINFGADRDERKGVPISVNDNGERLNE